MCEHRQQKGGNHGGKDHQGDYGDHVFQVPLALQKFPGKMPGRFLITQALPGPGKPRPEKWREGIKQRSQDQHRGQEIKANHPGQGGEEFHACPLAPKGIFQKLERLTLLSFKTVIINPWITRDNKKLVVRASVPAVAHKLWFSVLFLK